MAVVRFGPIVQSASGALGGVVFSRQGGTSIVRTRPLLRNPQSARQLQVRNNYNHAAAWWRTMSDENRLAWFRCAQSYRRTKPDGTSNPLTAWQTYAMVALRLLDTPYGYYAEDLAPDPFFGELETLAIRLDVWPGGPVNMVHSRGTLTQEPPDVISIVYDTHVQRTFRTSSTLPGRLALRAWHDTSRTYSNNLLSTYNCIRGPINTSWATVAQSPTIGEFIKWFCHSHFMAWPASTLWSGITQVPNVSTELITNGDFELPDDGGAGARTNWSTEGAGSAATETFDVWGDAYSLTWSQPYATGIGRLLTPENLNLGGPGNYTLRYAARCTAGVPWSTVYLRQTGMPDVAIDPSPPPADSTWSEYSKAFSLTSPYTHCALRLYHYAGAAMSVCLDNISIRRNL